MKTLVSMSEEGRLTIPAEARRALNMTGRVQFEVEVIKDVIILRPTVAVPREQAWIYSVDHQEQLQQALLDVASGRVYDGSSPQVAKLLEQLQAAKHSLPATASSRDHGSQPQAARSSQSAAAPSRRHGSPHGAGPRASAGIAAKSKH
jgi:bifunctional DNA-binding transcriptional regulator/antitoxin component of YhaV-PrlF toxin-antitoxin module